VAVSQGRVSRAAVSRVSLVAVSQGRAAVSRVSRVSRVSLVAVSQGRVSLDLVVSPDQFPFFGPRRTTPLSPART